MKRLAPVLFALTLAVAPASAQDALLQTCAGLSVTSPQGDVPAQVQDQFRFLCGQVVQGMSAVQPTVGIAFSGGAHTLGTATTIGRRLGLFPRVSATVRVNAALADVPDLLDGYAPTFGDDDRLQPMGTVRLPALAVQGDVVLGLFNGFSVAPGIGGLGAVDLLGSVSLVPAVSAIGLTESIVNVGAGARVGILRQGLVLPGVSVSGMYRTMRSDVSFGELGPDPTAGDPAEFSADLSTWSFRAGASKGFLLLDLAAGLGYDIYSSDVHFDWQLRCPPQQCGEEIILESDGGVQGRLRTAAWNAYGNAGLNFLLLRLVAELGYQQPLDIVDAAALRRAGLPEQPPVLDDVTGGRFFLSLGARLTL
jgi:hypothetical protein